MSGKGKCSTHILQMAMVKTQLRSKIFGMHFKPKQEKKEESRKHVQLPEAATVFNCS